MAESDVIIRLTREEAVILDAILRRYSETDKLTIDDKSEQQALWNLQCLFEKLPNREWPSVAQARAALRGEL